MDYIALGAGGSSSILEVMIMGTVDNRYFMQLRKTVIDFLSHFY